MRKSPRLIRLKSWVRLLLAAAVVILGLTVVVACGSVSNSAPAAAVPTSTIDSSATPTIDPSVTPTVDTSATPTIGPSATPTAGTTPTATSAPTPTSALAIQPTTVPTTPPPTTPPGPTPTPTPLPMPTPTPTPLPTPTPTPTQSSGNTVTVWIQVTDSCEQALSGATFSVSGPGISTTTSATSGGNPVGIGTTGGCPTQQGNCVATSTGCTTATLDIPSSGTATYQITVAGTAPGYGTNASYAICEGGSDCPHGPEVATVLVSSGGSVSATTLNIYPDGVSVTWPTNKGAYSGTQSDPVLFHEFGVAAHSTANSQCDGDYDADDYLTGSRGMYCDSDKGSSGS